MECTKGFYEELLKIENEVHKFELEELAGVYEKAYEVIRRINKRIIKLERSKQK